MAVYSATVETTAAAAGAAYAALVPGAVRASIREIEITNTTAVTCAVGLIRTLTQGTATAPVLGQVEDIADQAAVGSVATAWSVAPTIAGSPVYQRRIRLPASIGSGVIWSWPDKALKATNAATGGLLLWNYTGTGQILCVRYSWEE